MKLVWLWWSLAVLLIAVVVVHLALALLSRRLALEAEHEHPPIGTFLDADGGRLHYLDTGPREAPVIVLVHGASTSLLDFQTSLQSRLDGDFRVVAIDRPGSGYSEVREGARGDPARQAYAIIDVLDALGIRRALWVGHSWGGSVVMAALLEHAERMSGGVAIAAATHPWDGSLPLPIRLAAVPLLGRVLSACWAMPIGQRMLTDGISETFQPEEPPDDIDAYLEKTGAALTMRPQSFRATVLDMTGLSASLASLAPRYAEIERALLLINGTADPVIPPERNAERVSAVLPAARMERIEGAGHMVHHTHAAEVAATIIDFANMLEQVPSTL